MRIDGQHFGKWFFESGKKKTNEMALTKTMNPEVKDEIQLNVSGKELNEFTELAKISGEIREEKVKMLKDNYESGQYNVTGQDVIGKILGDKLHVPKNN